MADKVLEAITLVEFQSFVAQFQWTREISDVHIHHTWRPRADQFDGHASLATITDEHIKNGWGDIAQHVTIDPKGGIWLGRNFNWSPKSANGFDGNAKRGPFMIALVGDFEKGQDEPTKAQLSSLIGVIKAVQSKDRLSADKVTLYNELTSKTGPGSTLDKKALIRDVQAAATPAMRELVRGTEGGPFPRSASRAAALVAAMAPHAPQPKESDTDNDHGRSRTRSAKGRGDSRGDRAPSPEAIGELADHVVNLERGMFSGGGLISTDRTDVDRIFAKLGEKAKRLRKQSELDGKPAKLRLLLYAHGGLNSESNAIDGAFRQLRFWGKNDVYPLFFIWETGLAETLRQMVQDAIDRIKRGRGIGEIFADAITNPLIEEIIRVLQGRRLWDAMKSSAERASAVGPDGVDGGARYTAARVAELVEAHGDIVEIHTAGHSAGSIFTAHLMSVLDEFDVDVTTAHFLAPAIRNDTFHRVLAPLVGNRVRRLIVFTMKKQLERADNVAALYRQSLLYLVSEALEAERHAPLIGLEAMLRADPKAVKLFGLLGPPRPEAKVIWSVSGDDASGNASGARSHGGFDEDPPTMNSVARWVLDKRQGQPIEPYEADARSRSAEDFWADQLDWPESLEHLIRDVPIAAAPKASADCPPPAQPVAGPTPPPTPAPSPSGARRALCIGIDKYQRIRPLGGCVADAKLWGRLLTSRGYEVTYLFDDQATAARIRESVRTLVRGARNGDSLVLQYSGHGTAFEDRDGDEAGTDTPVEDECLCAVDCDTSGDDGLIIDDEFAVIFDGLPDGVQMTMFADSCHSGTVTRAAFRAARAARSQSAERRFRFVAPTSTMRRAYQSRLAELSRSRAPRSPRQKDVLFSACRSSELAYEQDGQGDFTRQATRVLEMATAAMTNSAFHDAVLKAFGPGPQQNPELHCDVGARDALFLRL